jgi:hypothetical protein
MVFAAPADCTGSALWVKPNLNVNRVKVLGSNGLGGVGLHDILLSIKRKEAG